MQMSSTLATGSAVLDAEVMRALRITVRLHTEQNAIRHPPPPAQHPHFSINEVPLVTCLPTCLPLPLTRKRHAPNWDQTHGWDGKLTITQRPSSGDFIPSDWLLARGYNVWLQDEVRAHAFGKDASCCCSRCHISCNIYCPHFGVQCV